MVRGSEIHPLRSTCDCEARFTAVRSLNWGEQVRWPHRSGFWGKSLASNPSLHLAIFSPLLNLQHSSMNFSLLYFSWTIQLVLVGLGESPVFWGMESHVYTRRLGLLPSLNELPVLSLFVEFFEASELKFSESPAHLVGLGRRSVFFQWVLWNWTMGSFILCYFLVCLGNLFQILLNCIFFSVEVVGFWHLWSNN